ncbi:unnamed protein product [Trichobilharzia regenti]|nr:unnamed protein product [Trichobilharzia regenti]
MRTTKQLISEGGILGLWRGGLPNVQRAALVNMGELTTYDTAKRWFAVRFRLEINIVRDVNGLQFIGLSTSSV